MASNRRKGGRSRRNDELKFAYSGPFGPSLDSRVGRTLPKTEERYTPGSAESYTVADRIGPDAVARLATAFGRSEGRRPRRRRRGGARRV